MQNLVVLEAPDYFQLKALSLATVKKSLRNAKISGAGLIQIAKAKNPNPYRNDCVRILTKKLVACGN